MPAIELKNICKGYGQGKDRTEVLKDINLSVETGEFVAIVGFTGSGKTTLMNIMAGLLKPDTGQALYKNSIIEAPGPDRGLVFQNYSLLPWLTVYENVYIAVHEIFPNLSKKEKKKQAMKYVNMVGLDHAQNKRPAELSGGMRQRTSVARTLSMNPDVLLLDEPLSALDALTRGTLQDEIAKIWEVEKKTIILITNDVDEGLILADRIIPLNPGPNATLGPEFKVNLKRPRDKKELNRNPEFIRLRNNITKYLLDIGKHKVENDEKIEFLLPDLKPKNLKKSSIYSSIF